MDSPAPRINPARLDQALTDVQLYIRDPEDGQFALKQFYSIRDYALGDDRLCSAQTARENCEQIKGYFPATAPESAFENLDEIANEIRRLQRREVPLFFRIATNPLVIGFLILAFSAYWFFLR